jgi:hypothetical protein
MDQLCSSVCVFVRVTELMFHFSSTQNVTDVAIWLGPISRRVTNSTQTKNHLHLFPLHLLPLTLPSAWQVAELVPLRQERRRERSNSTVCGSDFVTRQKSTDLFLQSTPITYAQALCSQLDTMFYILC